MRVAQKQQNLLLRQLKGVQAELKMRLQLAQEAPRESRTSLLDRIDQDHQKLGTVLSALEDQVFSMRMPI